MRIVFLPLATVVTDSLQANHGALTRAVARELAGRVASVSDVETVFRPFVSMIEGRRRFGVYGERWSREELAKLFREHPEADLVVHGDAAFGDPFRLSIEILRLPDLEPVAEESFEAPGYDGFTAVADAAGFIVKTAGGSAERKLLSAFPARGFEAWLDLARGREVAASLDGWGDTGDPAEIFEPFLSALDREPGMTAAREELGFLAVRAAEGGHVPKDAAVAAAKTHLDAVPKSREGWTALGRIHAVTNDLPKAEDAYKKALELDPGRASLRYEIGMVQLRAERFGRAAKVLETVKTDPALGAEALFQLGQIRIGKNDVEGAVTLWRESLDRDPSPSVVWASYARALVSLGRFDEAEAAFEGGVKAEPVSPALHLVAGSYLAEQDSYGPAIDHLRRVLSLLGTEPGAHYYLGRCYEATGDRLRALHHLRRAMRAGGEIGDRARELLTEFSDPAIEEKLAAALESALPLPAEDQVTILASLLKEETAFVDARLRLGIAYLATDRAKAAEKQFRWVTKRLPEEAEGWSGLATALRGRKKLKAAEEAHLEALERAPNVAAYRLNHADTLIRMGRYAEAGTEVDRARSLEPTNPLIPGFVASIKLHLSQTA
ncbi:MAG: tetratricopeptide repeat protein [Planctomycetota bacterium]